MSSLRSTLTLASRFPLNNGCSIPRLGLGTWRSDRGKVQNAVVSAIEYGIRHIDCAAVYGNEQEVGNGINLALEANESLQRSDLFLTSKIWNTMHAPPDVVESILTTLSDLQTNYLDLLLIHFPVSWTKDSSFPHKTKWANVPIKDTWTAMEAAVQKGLVKSIGVSNFSIQEIQEILEFATIPPAMNQVELHPYLNQAELKKFCYSNNIGVTAYSPLGNLNPEQIHESPLSDPVIVELSKKYNKSPAQILIRWSLEAGNVCLTKSDKPHRIKENIQVFDFQLSEKDFQKINDLSLEKPKRLFNPPFREGFKPLFPK